MRKKWLKKAIIVVMGAVTFFNMYTQILYAAPTVNNIIPNEQELVEISDYNLQTQTEETSYVSDFALDPITVFDESISTYAIIGSDNRTIVSDTTVAPYRYVGRLVTYYTVPSTGAAMMDSGSAFLVGPKLVMTAAHCLYPVWKGEICNITKVMFYPGRNGNNLPYGGVQVTVLHVPTKYKQNALEYEKNYDEKYDYAVMELATAVGNTTGYFRTDANYMVGTGENVGSSLKVIVAGYPGAVSERNKLYRQAGTVNFMGDGYLLDYTMDIESGQSGGPLYYKESGKYYVMGIITSDTPTQNYGRRLTNAVLQLVKKYS